MSGPQLIWLALILAQVALLFLFLQPRRTQVPILPELQPSYDQLTAALATLSSNAAALKAKADAAPSAQDLTDTAAAFQSVAATAAALASAIAPSSVTPPVIS